MAAKRASYSAATCTSKSRASRAFALLIPVIAALLLVYMYWWWTSSATAERFSSQKQWIMAFVHMDGCGHCVTFKPTWKEFAAKHGAELKSSYAISLMDFERKDWEAWRKSKGVNVEIAGFPTVVMIDGATMTESARFSADRTVDNLHSWALQIVRQ